MIPTDRWLRYEELSSLLAAVAAEHPNLVAVESIGRSHRGRDIWLVTLTDSSTGSHDTKPAMWVDANIHSVELTASVAAMSIVKRVVEGFGTDPMVTTAMRTRTLYVVPRVNPDGAEWAMAESPRFRRSSVRRWPWNDGHTPEGLHPQDVDGDGCIRSMRIADPNGSWTVSPDDDRLVVPVPPDGIVADGAPRYRLLDEGLIEDYDGFTVPYRRAAESLDMNRNYPAGWGTNVPGSGDYPGSEPEIAALLKAMRARPNICGFNAYHTSGGVLLRPSSTKPDSVLPPADVMVWKRLAERCAELTDYPSHSVFEDFTWDKQNTMAGASDDFAYEHLGVFGWTTEYWDAAYRSGAERLSADWWYFGPTAAQELAYLTWSDANAPGNFAPWTEFDHPQLGTVEIGGWDGLRGWTNPPTPEALAHEVRGHADFALYQALTAPCVEIVHTQVTRLGDDTWRVSAGIANTGWLRTTVSAYADKEHLVLPLVAELRGAEVVGSPARVELGQLGGRSTQRTPLDTDGTPDRRLVSWIVTTGAGTEIDIEARHQRAGTARCTIVLTAP